MSHRIDRRKFFRLLGASSALGLGKPLLRAALEMPGSLVRRARSKVLILGAGPAGLAAALELKRAGHEVTVLEATLRAGGRVHTVRNRFSDGLIAEAGAGRFPPHHNLTFHYLKEFGIKTVPFYPAKGLDTYLLRGKRILAPRGADPTMAEVPLNLTEEERKLGFNGIYNKFVGEGARPFGKGWNAEHGAAAALLDESSFFDYLRARGVSADAAHYLASGFEDDSALDYIRDAASHDVPTLFKVPDGNDRLPAEFARRLSAEILFGAAVSGIANERQGASVTFTQGGQTRRVSADHVICTLPFSVLRGIEIQGQILLAAA